MQSVSHADCLVRDNISLYKYIRAMDCLTLVVLMHDKCVRNLHSLSEHARSYLTVTMYDKPPYQHTHSRQLLLFISPSYDFLAPTLCTYMNE